MSLIDEIEASYQQLFVKQNTNIKDHAEFLKKLLPKGPLWNIEMPKEKQISPLAINSLEKFGALQINREWTDWGWQPASLDFGHQWAGFAGTIYSDDLYVVNNNEFPVQIDSYGWLVINYAGGGIFSMAFPDGLEIPALGFRKVVMTFDLEPQSVPYYEYHVQPYVVNTNMPTPQLLTSVWIQGEWLA